MRSVQPSCAPSGPMRAQVNDLDETLTVGTTLGRVLADNANTGLIGDPALSRHAAILPYRALALPVSLGPGGAQGVHASRRRAGGRAQRLAHSWRLPPQPVDRIPAPLPDTPRLRVSAGSDGRFQAIPQHAPHRRTQGRDHGRDARLDANL